MSSLQIPTPPGGRGAPGGETPPGGDAPPGGRGAPGGQSTPSAPLGRPPRVRLRPLARHAGQRNRTVTQTVRINPDRGRQLREAIFTRRQHQQQMRQHVQATMPQYQQGNQPQGPQVPPQSAGMGQRTQARRDARNATRRQQRAQQNSPQILAQQAQYIQGMSAQQAQATLQQSHLAQAAHTAPSGLDPDRPQWLVTPPANPGESDSDYQVRFDAYRAAYDAQHKGGTS